MNLSSRLAAVAFSAAALAPQLAHAYDNDTHYYWTYYLARKSGYTMEQARRVASADISVDLDKATEPFQDLSPIPPATSIRRDYHSFLDSFTLTTAEAEKEHAERDQAFHAATIAAGNVGSYLHFYQDSYSHAGYFSVRGHALDGHRPDYLSESKQKAQDMTLGTLGILVDFRNRAGSPPAPVVAPTALDPTISADLDKLIAANAPAFFSSPDAKKAQAILEASLGEKIPDIIDYGFDKNGVPQSATGQYKVFG